MTKTIYYYLEGNINTVGNTIFLTILSLITNVMMTTPNSETTGKAFNKILISKRMQEKRHRNIEINLIYFIEILLI